LNETPDDIENDYDLLNIEPHFIDTLNMKMWSNYRRWDIKVCL